jgi:hypothetical protein
MKVEFPEHVMPLKESEHNTTRNVEYIAPNQAYKLLGVQITTDGNTEAQETALAAKCQKMAAIFSQSSLSAANAHQGYHSVFLPAVRYPLAATNIPWDCLIESQMIITTSILPKLGFNRHFPRQVVYAPAYFGGIKLAQLFEYI